MPTLTPTDWLASVRDDLITVEETMRQRAHMNQANLDVAIDAIISAGGKRMRPAITILASRLFDALWSPMISVAASIELLHTATLVHDDLVDGAEERRGVATLHSRLPLGVTVLTGDYLFAQAAALAADADSVRIVKLFSDTLVRICKGEILQAQTRWKVPTLEIYQERIYGKTAALFEAAAAAGAILGGGSERQIAAMSDYGRELGMAFQIIDDALDFESTTERLGKPVGHDMRQGILNLPVLYYVQEGYLSEGELRQRLERGERLDDLIASIRQTGMVERSLEVARRHADHASQALTFVPGGEYTDHLHSLSHFALSRAY
jgi:geranylgeranyl pyrophosphate synthase